MFSASPPTRTLLNAVGMSQTCQEETLRGYPELAIWSLMRLSGISRIGSHHFLRSVHKSSHPDREGQSATSLALDRNSPPHHSPHLRHTPTPRPPPLSFPP